MRRFFYFKNAISWIGELLRFNTCWPTIIIIIIINRTLHNSIQNTDLSVNKKSKKIIGKKGNLIELNPKEKNCKKKLTDMLSLGYLFFFF